MQALERYSKRNNTCIVTRQNLIDQELKQIIQDTNSTGSTPTQTLSRVLQELGRDNVISLEGGGIYLLLSKPIYIEGEDLPDEVIDIALKKNKLKFEMISTDNPLSITRRRRGQQRIRTLTIMNYHHRCAFCDIVDSQLLVAAHISRWADDIASRGNLSNVICMCKIHDALFEYGYISINDDFKIIKRKNVNSSFIKSIFDETHQFSMPDDFVPLPEFLQIHRNRVKLPV